MKTPYTQNNFLAYLLVLLALFILLFFTKSIYSDLQIWLDDREQKQQEFKEKEVTLKELNELQDKLNGSGSTALEEIQGLSWEFSDKDILEYIHSYAKKTNVGESNLIIRDIAFSDPVKSDLWFNQVDISLSAIISSETLLFTFLNYLTSDTGTYRFYITSFNYPMNENSGNLQVSIPLTLYYK